MSNRLLDYFKKITPLSLEEQDALIGSMDIKTFRAGDFILKQGQYNQNTFFVLQGLVRQFKLHNEDEITTGFFNEGKWILSLTGFSEHCNSEHSLFCLEDTSVVVGNEEKAQQLFKQFPRFETISRIVMENVFSEQQKWLSSYLTDTPEQRYLTLLETQPEIFQQVPQYQIASYIGVKPESLSRIRKRIQEKR